MTMPTTLCPNRMQVHSIHQETPEVWTLNLINHDFYSYQPGQFALVSINNSDETMRAYTLSSSPGLSPFITLTVRRLENGVGSGWLTSKVKPGDYLWLSDAQGEFTCAGKESTRYLMLAAGCGITPIMSMTRWLLNNQPKADITIIFNIRERNQFIFENEWLELANAYPHNLNFILMSKFPEDNSLFSGRISQEKIATLVPDIASRTVMCCGPNTYMEDTRRFAINLGVPAKNIFIERFGDEPVCVDENEQLTMTIRHPLSQIKVPVGVTLLSAMEDHKVPVFAACRAGVCGSCKTRIVSGDYDVTSTSTLTAEEIAQGYVLACSCRLKGNVELA